MSDAPVSDGVSLESLVAEVADEFLARQRRGERPAVEEYTARHPEHAAVIADGLAALCVVGLSGASGTLASDGVAQIRRQGAAADDAVDRVVARLLPGHRRSARDDSE